MSDVTQILSAIEQGDPSAAEQLLPLVYEELRKLAAQKMTQEDAGQTLQATALVHEAYLRLVDRERAQHWVSRNHFFAAAATAMQRILVDNARKKQRLKRGGQFRRGPLEDVEVDPMELPFEDLLALDDALAKLERENPQQAKIVQLRFFAGLNHDEVGKVLDISAVTVKRHWRYARAWLRQEMRDSSGTDH